MRERDKQIIRDLDRFMCLSRDHIVNLYFSHTKQPITQANIVLKRLRRDGYIKCNTQYRKYIYMLSDCKMKPNSQKINHYLAIADFYVQIRRIQEPKEFIPEHKDKKGNPEADAFMIWRGLPWFVEVQCSYFSSKQISDKLNRYEKYYINGKWEEAEWQPSNKRIFPLIWITGKGKYDVGTRPFRVVQGDISDIVKMMTPKQKPDPL